MDASPTPPKGEWAAAARGEAVLPFLVMDVLAAATAREKAGHPVFHMEVGQPGAGAPLKAREAVVAALQGGSTLGYTNSLGDEALRARLARHYTEQYGVPPVSPDRVVVTTGSSGAFMLVFAAAFNAGDRVAVACPGYPCYRNMLRMLDLEAVPVKVDATTHFQLTVEALERAAQGGRLAGVVVASPSNPTGSMLTPRELQALCEFCHARAIRLISDEIYHGITYGERESATALAYSSSAVVLNSFSKYYCMAGWRLGWAVLPPSLLGPVTRLQQNAFLCAPAVAQVAALAALDCTEELEGHVSNYRLNRTRLLEGLPKAGLPPTAIAPCEGAFYLYVDVGTYTTDSSGFCQRILDETGVACTPGVDFDPEHGHQTMRLSFCARPADIAQALAALQAWLPLQPRRPEAAPLPQG